MDTATRRSTAAPVLALVDRGWVWAVAHVRGGSEKGRAWFEAARQLKKKTSFTDFVSCAEALIASGHTRRKRIAIHGFSAGGLLVGAADNMRPDLWSAVIGQAPFVDMLNTMSDATHPLVPLTRPVWGDPLSDPRAYDYIASYSPYENVRTQPYPATLATTAIGDDRVGFWEPAKWIATLRRHRPAASRCCSTPKRRGVTRARLAVSMNWPRWRACTPSRFGRRKG